MNLSLRTVTNFADLKDFVGFPFQLYRDHPYWVPPLVKSELAWLSPSKNPAFQHAEAILLTAYQDNKMVGRIAGFINHLETERIGQAHARFGWFDFVDEENVSRLLLKTIEQWALERHCTRLKGPYGFNSLDKNGMLVEGFEEMGGMTTLYNFPYYPKHLEKLGFQKELEWLEIKAKLPNPFPVKITRAAELVAQRYQLQIDRPKNKLEMLALGQVFFDLLQETYQQLPSFVPISKEQQAFYIKNYIGVLPPKFVCIVRDRNGETIGFGITMPSMAKALQRAKGKFLPFGFFHLLLAQYFNDSGDLTLIGVKEEWRKRGVHGIIFSDIGNTFLKLGYHYFNVNPMLEQNHSVLALWKDFEHRVYKRRRTVFKELKIEN